MSLEIWSWKLSTNGKLWVRRRSFQSVTWRRRRNRRIRFTNQENTITKKGKTYNGKNSSVNYNWKHPQIKSILAKKRNDRRGTSSLPSKRKRLSSPAPSRKRMLSTDNIITPSTSRASTHLVTSLLNRTVVQPPSAHEVDMNSDAPNIKCREISPSKLTLGFLGLGIMGSTIVKNLILTGHKVIVWNRTATKVR